LGDAKAVGQLKQILKQIEGGNVREANVSFGQFVVENNQLEHAEVIAEIEEQEEGQRRLQSDLEAAKKALSASLDEEQYFGQADENRQVFIRVKRDLEEYLPVQYDEKYLFHMACQDAVDKQGNLFRNKLYGDGICSNKTKNYRKALIEELRSQATIENIGIVKILIDGVEDLSGEFVSAVKFLTTTHLTGGD
jgi:hypothetical protein